MMKIKEMSLSEKWNKVKADLELAVEEGFERDFQNEPETPEGGKFIAYRNILDMMNRLDGEQ